MYLYPFCETPSMEYHLECSLRHTHATMCIRNLVGILHPQTQHKKCMRVLSPFLTSKSLDMFTARGKTAWNIKEKAIILQVMALGQTSHFAVMALGQTSYFAVYSIGAI